jgi:hypothetical protein
VGEQEGERRVRDFLSLSLPPSLPPSLPEAQSLPPTVLPTSLPPTSIHLKYEGNNRYFMYSKPQNNSFVFYVFKNLKLIIWYFYNTTLGIKKPQIMRVMYI